MKSCNLFLGLLFFIAFLPFQLFGRSIPREKELRGAWVATFYNIDWPSSRMASKEQQQKDLISILDYYQAHGFNAIFFQVRPEGDALYPSSYEPWSKWVTGERGKAPTEFWDPLAFAIQEAHKRGMELHAWINPFRAYANPSQEQEELFLSSHPHPEWFYKYGKNIYYNPAIPEARAFVTQVIGDIVTRYNINGIHFDDYFYPYKIKGTPLPDEDLFNTQFTDSFKSIDDWRRNNVNEFIQGINQIIKSQKPGLPLGISPFGVWRNKADDPRGSATKAGVTSYDDLYGDILLWLENNWIDYVAPQLYWHINHPTADFKTLVEWWNNNSYGHPVYIGHAVYKANKNSKKEPWRKKKELRKQMALTYQASHIKGNIFYNTSSFKKEPFQFPRYLKRKYYKNLTSPPSLKNSACSLPPPMDLTAVPHKEGYLLQWKETGDSARYMVYCFKGRRAKDLKKATQKMGFITENQYLTIPKQGRGRYTFVVTTLDAFARESQPSKPVTTPSR